MKLKFSKIIIITLISVVSVVTALIVFLGPAEEQTEIVLKDYLIKSVPEVLAASRPAQFAVSPPRGGFDYENLSTQGKIELVDAKGNDNSKFFDINFKANDQGVVDVNVTPISSRFRPGKYTVTAYLPTSQGIRDLSQDFYWGVLAINTNKSMYLLNEQAYLQIGVLDDFGNTICDAELELRITSPDGEVKILNQQELSSYHRSSAPAEVIINNSECGPNNVIDTPDYYAYYDLAGAGIYQLELTARTKNGERSLKDFVEVKEYLPFEVERIGPTRIWPKAIYEMKFIIKANEDYQGFLNERLPQSFEVYNSGGEVHSVDGFLSEITWLVDFKAGETYEFLYEFDAPDISPEFYLLGPLTMGIRSYRDNGEIFWQENRKWQIANDDATGFTDPSSNGTGSTCASPANAYTSNDVDTGCNPTASQGVVDVDNFGFAITSTSIDGIEVRVEAAINNVPATYYASCQLLDASGSPVGNTKNTSNWTTTSDVAYTIGGTSDMWGTSLTEADIEDADFGVRCTTVKTSGTPARSLLVDNIDIQITYTASSNNAPTVTSVSDSPDPVAAGDITYFTVDWNDADSGEMAKAHICKTNAISSASCTGGSWCDSPVFTNRDPETCSYTTSLSEASGTAKDYYAFVCDDEDACSSSSSGTFTVEDKDPTAPADLLAENMLNPVNMADITPEFSSVFQDPNLDDYATKWCVEVNAASDFTGTDMWTSDGDNCNTGNSFMTIIDFTDPSSNGTGSTCTNPANVYTSNDTRATCSDNQIIDVDTFGFSIPSGDDINGVEVRIEWQSEFGPKKADCQLLDNNGNATGTTKSISTDSGSDVTQTMGGNTDIWGVSLTETIVEDIDFGVRCTIDDVSGFSDDAYIDNIDMSISHSDPLSGSTCDQGDRCQDISYSGSALSLNNTVYYWRTWYWDHDGVISATSSVNNFTMANQGQGVRLQGGRMQGGRLK